MGAPLHVKDLIVSLFRGLGESHCHDATTKACNVLQHEQHRLGGCVEEWSDEKAEETQLLAAVAAFELRQRGRGNDADCLEFGVDAVQLSRNKAFSDSLRVVLVLREKVLDNIVATDRYGDPRLMGGGVRKSMRCLESPPMALSVSSPPPIFSSYGCNGVGLQKSEASSLWECHDRPLPITCFLPGTFMCMPFGEKYFGENNGRGLSVTNATSTAGFHGLVPNLKQDKAQHCLSFQLSPSGAEYFLSAQPDLVLNASRSSSGGASSFLPPPPPHLPLCLPVLGEQQHRTSSSLVPLSEDGNVIYTSLPPNDIKDGINAQLEVLMVGWDADRHGVEGFLPLEGASAARKNLQLTREGWKSVAHLIAHDKAGVKRLGRPGDDAWLSRRALEAMQGMPAPGILYNPSGDCPSMHADPAVVVGAARGLLESFSTAGQSLWWLQSLADYLRYPVTDECGKPTLPFGSVVQAFGCGLAEQVSIIQADILGFLEEIDQYTLLSLTHTTRPLHWLIRALANLCLCDNVDKEYNTRFISVAEAADALPRGPQLLSMLFAKALQSETLTGDGEVDNIVGFSSSMRLRCSLMSLLRSASAPYLEFLSRWLWTGRLTRWDDPLGEFFIRCTVGDNGKTMKTGRNGETMLQQQSGNDFMEDAFEINKDSLSASQALPFLRPQLLSRVIASGKSLAMLRMCSWEHYNVAAITPAPPLIMGLGGHVELRAVQSAWKELRCGQVRRALALSRKGRAEAALIEMELLDRLSEREMRLNEERNTVMRIREHRDALDKAERSKQRFWAQELLRIDAGRKEELKTLARIENEKHNKEARIAEENVHKMEKKAAQWLYETFKVMGDEKEARNCITSWIRTRCNKTRDEGIKMELRNLLEEDRKTLEAEKSLRMSMVSDAVVAAVAQTLSGKEEGLTSECKSDIDVHVALPAARQLHHLRDDSLEVDNGRESSSLGSAISTKPPIAAEAMDRSTVLNQIHSIASSDRSHGDDNEGTVLVSASNQLVSSLSGEPFEGTEWGPSLHSKQDERRTTLPLPPINSPNMVDSVESNRLGAAVTFGSVASAEKEEPSGGVGGALLQPMEHKESSRPSLGTELVKPSDLSPPLPYPPHFPPVHTPPPPVPQSMEHKSSSALSPHVSPENIAVLPFEHWNADAVTPLTSREEAMPRDVGVKCDDKGHLRSPCPRKEIEKHSSRAITECFPAVVVPNDGVGMASVVEMGIVDTVVEEGGLETGGRKCKGDGETRSFEFGNPKSTKLEEYLKRAIAVARSGTQGLQCLSDTTEELSSTPLGSSSLCAPISSRTYSVMPLYESIFHSLEVPIALQCNLIDSMASSYVLQEGQMGSQVLDLRCFLLGHSGGFLSEFVGCFYDSIVLLGGNRSSCSDAVLNRVIKEAHAQTAATSRLEDQLEGWGGNGARFCYQLHVRKVKMDDDVSVMQQQPLPGPTQMMTPPSKGKNPKRKSREEENQLYLDDTDKYHNRAALGLIRPSYSLSWPSCVMIPPHVMRMYEEIHCVLLEQHLTIHRLRRYWVMMRECWKVAGATQQVREQHRGFHLRCRLRELSVFHHALHHVANCLFQYCRNQTDVGWPELHEVLFCNSTIREAASWDNETDVSFDGYGLNPKLDLAFLHDSHEAYVKSVHRRFFLQAGVTQYSRVRQRITEFQDVVGEADRLWSQVGLELSLGHEITAQCFHEFSDLQNRFTTVRRELVGSLLSSAQCSSTDVWQIQGLLALLEP